jgi:hypothetical protein
MRKWISFSLSILLIVATLGFREWLLHQELDHLQSQARSQITAAFESAESASRLHELQSTQLAYERWMEPSILVAQRLAWPPSRHSELADWRRSVNRALQDQSYARSLQLREQVQSQTAVIASEMEPSIERLQKLFSEQSRILNPAEIQLWLNAELEALNQHSRQQDLQKLDEIKRVGVAQAKALERKLKKLSHESLGRYVSSGEFSRDALSPVLTQIFSLRQASLRQSTWEEYQKTITQVLQKRRKLLLAQKAPPAVAQRKKEEIESLFNSMARMVDAEEGKQESVPSVDPRAQTELSGAYEILDPSSAPSAE